MIAVVLQLGMIYIRQECFSYVLNCGVCGLNFNIKKNNLTFDSFDIILVALSLLLFNLVFGYS